MKASTIRLSGSTRTMAFNPLSVTHGAPPGPTMTPWGREPAPNGVWLVSPVSGSSHPSSPDPCAVYQTPPLTPGATSWGRDPSGSGKDCKTGFGRVWLLISDGAERASAVGLGLVAGYACNGDVESEMTVDAGSEAGTGLVAAAGSDSKAGSAEPLHPADVKRMRVPRKIKRDRPAARFVPADLFLII